MSLIASPTRYLFFTGKGGVGKTSLACATAVGLADAGKRVLLVSTDPASNLEHVFDVEVGSGIVAVPGVPGLDLANIDPEEAAHAYRERAMAPLRGVATEDELRTIEEQLSGACTVEIAAFDEFTGILIGARGADRYDHVIFDTAPTGHTLRLLNLPAAWSDFIEANPRGASCLGPSSALQQQQNQYARAVESLKDAAKTTVVLVTRPERGSLREAARTAGELDELGLQNQRVVVNGHFVARDRRDPVAVALEERGSRSLSELPSPLDRLPRSTVPLRPFNVVGLDAVRNLLADEAEGDAHHTERPDSPTLPPVDELIDELERAGRGLIMVMGKGGVGKTTIAAAIAVGLAERGRSVTLTTTDPAAHVGATVAGQLPNLVVGRIDPAAESAAYKERVLGLRGSSLTPEERELLAEDLESPCTEEVAVFHAFSRIVGKGRSEFVVIDTAPTGHTLLLLDTTGAYHTEVLRSLEGSGKNVNAVTPLMRLRDSAYTKMILVTLPESTPVQEATELQSDLQRAGIAPHAWVVNASLAATGVSDPLLTSRAAEEIEHIERVANELAERVYLTPWMIEEPVGVDLLRALASGVARSESAQLVSA
ncbi:MAG: arsenical pump-driving ATPase [Thermomicrobiales bacterium]